MVVLVCESSDSSSSETVTVHSLYFDRTKECNASLDPHQNGGTVYKGMHCFAKM